MIRWLLVAALLATFQVSVPATALALCKAAIPVQLRVRDPNNRRRWPSYERALAARWSYQARRNYGADYAEYARARNKKFACGTIVGSQRPGGVCTLKASPCRSLVRRR